LQVVATLQAVKQALSVVALVAAVVVIAVLLVPPHLLDELFDDVVPNLFSKE
jgi:hypothetical protein